MNQLEQTSCRTRELCADVLFSTPRFRRPVHRRSGPSPQDIPEACLEALQASPLGCSKALDRYGPLTVRTLRCGCLGDSAAEGVN